MKSQVVMVRAPCVGTPKIIFVTSGVDERTLFYGVADVLQRLEYDTVFEDGLDELDEREVRERSSIDSLNVRGGRQYVNEDGETTAKSIVYYAGGDTLQHDGCEYDYRSVLMGNDELITRRKLDHVDVFFRELCRSVQVLAGWFTRRREIPIFPEDVLGDPEMLSMLTYYDDDVSGDLPERVERSTTLFDAERIDGGWYLRPSERPVNYRSPQMDRIEDEIGLQYY